jgi:hypothetical protein
VLRLQFDSVLLKNEFGAIRGQDGTVLPRPILRSSTLIAMMQATNLREGNNDSCTARGRGQSLSMKIARQHASGLEGGVASVASPVASDTLETAHD